LDEKFGVQARFLLGPAGSGKTFRCLAEIRAALQDGADDPPLILLAPKQATFQVERQLLAPEVRGESSPKTSRIEPLNPVGTRCRASEADRQVGPTGVHGEDRRRPLPGYTRLQIFSFERLARFVLDKLKVAPPDLLAEEGRIMVLRALLMRHAGELKLFRASARRPAFACQLSQSLSELQRHQITVDQLRKIAARPALVRELRDKLHDLALLLDAYTGWLGKHELQDADRLLDAATEALRAESRITNCELRISGLWLDGFAEMTPQELDLLAGVIPFCERATLAFCLDESGSRIGEAKDSWLSLWSAVGKTFQQCRQRLEGLRDCEIETELLPHDPKQTRFAGNSELAAVERHLFRQFTQNALRDTPSVSPTSVSISLCANPEAEAVFAARAILKFVRAGNRFRECGVMVRELEGYHQPLASVFRRYGVPFFLDRRESVAHHPLAELTRGALRTVAGDWPHEDWFAALKAGFCPASETEIDRLENAALEFGWRGRKWHAPLPDADFERLRQKILPPFADLAARLAQFKNSPTGPQLAETLRFLWDELRAEEVLEQWSLPEGDQSAIGNRQSSIHLTVWEQMNAWLDNVALAFPGEPLPLREWLPILEAGLATLTVGVIPPVLDEVLIGAIDRARNPDLKFALVLGVNEAVFPAVPAAPQILTDADRDAMAPGGIRLGADLRERLARERYYGYIACTRASEQLAVTFARHDAGGKPLGPSPFITHLRRIFPELEIQEWPAMPDWLEAEHASELAGALVQIMGPCRESGNMNPDIGCRGRHSTFNIQHRTSNESKEPSPHPDPLPSHQNGSGEGNASGQHSYSEGRVASAGSGVQRASEADRQVGPTGGHREAGDTGWPSLLKLPAMDSLARGLAQLREADPEENLSAALAEKLFGPVLRTSVSRLEEFAQCPFRFFVRSGLRAGERKVFELDARERGSFQHDVLKTFHERLAAAGKQWRDLTPAQAREQIRAIAVELAEQFRGGLLRDTARTEFEARMLGESLQDFVEVVVSWLREQNEFDPVAAELDFGSEGAPAPAWEVDLGGGWKLALLGRIDRVDLWRKPGGGAAAALVLDYKSGNKKLDAVLVAHGVQLQLLAYLNVLRHWADPRAVLGVARLAPAGVFYVNLRGQYESGGTRTEALEDAGAARKRAYRHSGRFDAGILPGLDRLGRADQFNYRLNQDGTLRKGPADAMPHAEFEKLLDRVEIQLREMGRAIFSGRARVDPYRKGAGTACEYCDYAAVCRIDPWTHQYRVLKAE
jgi:ATP-dependent helicase/nuclease subunit B